MTLFVREYSLRLPSPNRSEDWNALIGVAERALANSADSKFCIICHADALDNGQGYDCDEDCPLAHFEVTK